MVSSRAGLNTSQQVKVAVDKALKIINDDMPNILPGFRLGYTELLDSHVSVDFCYVIYAYIIINYKGASILYSTVEEFYIYVFQTTENFA